VKLSAAVTAVLLAVAAASLASRFLPVPFGLYTVASGSMEPSIRVLDLALVLGRAFGVGDVVVWCSSPTYCVIHRVIRVVNGYVVTKGDANPVPDPRIPEDLVRGRVAAVVPRELWLGALLTYVAYLLVRNWRTVTRSASAAVLYFPLIAYSALVLSAALLVSPQTSLHHVVSRPEVYLSRTEFVDLGDRCAVSVSYHIENVQVEGILATYVSGVPARVLEYSSTYLLIEIPEELGVHVAATGRLNVSVEAALTRMGHLRGTYTVLVPLRKLGIYVANGSLVVENANCLPVRVNVTWAYAEAVGRPWSYSFSVVTLGRGVHVLRPPEAPYVYVDIRYIYYGAELHYRLEVRKS